MLKIVSRRRFFDPRGQLIPQWTTRIRKTSFTNLLGAPWYIISYPLFADAETGIYPHAALQYQARPKAKRGIAMLSVDKFPYPMLRADSRFWLVNNREIWRRISRLTSSAWDIKTKERHWWRHNGDSDRRPLSLPLRYDLVTLCLYGDLGQINVIAGILKLRKRFRMSQILFEHGMNSLPLVCFRGYGNLSTLSIAIPRLAFGRAWYCDAACG